MPPIVRARHWADDIAEKLAGSAGHPEISTGISPSGPIHIGNLREVMTADVVFRALKELRQDVGFHYVADNFDPLRRVYPFLDPRTYAPLVGKPLSEIPCPCGHHPNYGEHFLQPFLKTLDELRIDVRVFRGDEMYKSGRMVPVILEALKGREGIAQILQDLTGKQVDREWSPFDPLCPACGRITGTVVTGFSETRKTVDYRCDCGSEGTVSMAGGGKLTWRVDWPARWKILGVTIEPFGKDHATAGGSYDTGKRISREIFGNEPPFPVIYEWISLKGQGDMSSSKGNVISIDRMLQVVPPEILRYLIVRTEPRRSIAFDPGLPLLSLVDEYDDVEASGRDPRALALCRASGFRAVGIPFKHLVNVVQMANFDFGQVKEILARGGYAVTDEEALRGRARYAKHWLEEFAPPEMKFTLQPALPPEASRLTPEQKRFLAEAAERLQPGMPADLIHQTVYGLAGELPPLKPAEAFQAIYLALLGAQRGPRVGWFLAFLDHEFVVRRFREAARQP
ncbi:MAG TPA: lysine--tRNA ligase [Candidatus Polarisedimenticolia bacterium]|nr:lysine--tRNA ligase [Candidatus Polarisedimenticolia bacterium]